MTTISYDVFASLDIRIAIVTDAVVVEGADRLLRLRLDVGSVEDGGLGERTIVSGIRKWYKPEDLRGTRIVYLANLEPKVIRGIESQGMILAGGMEEVALLRPEKELPAGTKIR